MSVYLYFLKNITSVKWTACTSNFYFPASGAIQPRSFHFLFHFPNPDSIPQYTPFPVPAHPRCNNFISLYSLLYNFCPSLTFILRLLCPMEFADFQTLSNNPPAGGQCLRPPPSAHRLPPMCHPICGTRRKTHPWDTHPSALLAGIFKSCNNFGTTFAYTFGFGPSAVGQSAKMPWRIPLHFFLFCDSMLLLVPPPAVQMSDSLLWSPPRRVEFFYPRVHESLAEDVDL